MKKPKKTAAKKLKDVQAKRSVKPTKPVSKRACARCGRKGFNQRTCRGTKESHD